MSALLVVLVTVAATPAGPATPSDAPRVPKVASLGLDAVDLNAQKAAFFADALHQELERQGIQVTGTREIQAVLGVERQKELLGCSTSSCMAELSGALGVDAILIGSLAQLGTGYGVNLKLVEAKSGASAGSFSARVADDDGLLATFRDAARELAPKLRARLGIPEPVATAEVRGGGGGRRWPAYAALGVGAVALGGGGVFYALAASERSKLDRDGLDRSAYEQIQRTGEGHQRTAVILGAVGVLGLAVGGALVALGGDDEGPRASAAFVPSEEGAIFAVGGTF